MVSLGLGSMLAVYDACARKNNTDRDALREPWPVRPFALELQENHEVRVTLFGLHKLPYTCLNDVTHVNCNNIYNNSSALLTRASHHRSVACRATHLLDRAAHLTRNSEYVCVLGPY